MKVIIVSDTHGRFNKLEKIRERHQDADLFIHCGDCETDDEYLYGFIAVRGNNDYYDYPEERVIVADKLKILVTHGHRYGYTNRLDTLVEKAKKLKCKIVCFGHTHKPQIVTHQDILILNPGSLWANRIDKPVSYIILVIFGDQIESVRSIEY